MIFIFLTVFIPTHPVGFSCGRKLENPERTHDFRQSVDRPSVSHEFIARIEPTLTNDYEDSDDYGDIIYRIYVGKMAICYHAREVYITVLA